MRMENVFFTKAKFCVVSALVRSKYSMFLRELCALTGIQLRSVQLAVEELVKDGFLISEKKKNRVYFEINPNHPDTLFLQKLFCEIENYKTQKRAEVYSKIAPRILQLNSEMVELVKNATRNT